MSVRRFRPSMQQLAANVAVIASDAGHVHTLATPHYEAVRGILCESLDVIQSVRRRLADHR